MNIKYTEEQKQIAIELRKNGVTIKNISIKLNVKLRTVEKWLSKKTQINDNLCHQYKIRVHTLKEDLENGLPDNPPIGLFVFNQEKITIEHRKFIERYEW